MLGRYRIAGKGLTDSSSPPWAWARSRESVGLLLDPAGLAPAGDAAGPCTPAMSIEALTEVSSAVSFAVARVGVGADCPCEVKGFTAQIPAHAERCGGDAGDPGGPRGVVTGETG